MIKEERFVATITVYCYGNKETAYNEAQGMVRELNKKHDCCANIEQMHRQPFGSFGSEKIEI